MVLNLRRLKSSSYYVPGPLRAFEGGVKDSFFSRSGDYYQSKCRVARVYRGRSDVPYKCRAYVELKGSCTEEISFSA